MNLWLRSSGTSGYFFDLCRDRTGRTKTYFFNGQPGRFAIATHEIGHLEVGLATGREAESIVVDDWSKGTVYWRSLSSEDDLSDYYEVLTILACPRAQFEAAEGSIPPEIQEFF